MKPAAVLTAAVLFLTLLTGCGCTEDSALPERLTIYLTEQKRIITVSREEYLTGCILACADPSFHTEALKAVAAACCGYAASVMRDRSANEFLGADLCDDPERCPAWVSPDEALTEYSGDRESCAKRLAEAAEYGAQHCPEYNGVPAYTPVCLTSTGKTDSGGEPWLPSLELPYDASGPCYSSTSTVPAEYARKALRKYTGSVILPPEVSDWFTDAEYTPGGILLTVRFGGAEITGKQLMKAFGLGSSAVTVSVSGEEFTFTSLGCGGNVGLSAYSAERLAVSGMTAGEILGYFFPGTKI